MRPAATAAAVPGQCHLELDVQVDLRESHAAMAGCQRVVGVPHGAQVHGVVYHDELFSVRPRVGSRAQQRGHGRLGVTACQLPAFGVEASAVSVSAGVVRRVRVVVLAPSQRPPLRPPALLQLIEVDVMETYASLGRCSACGVGWSQT